MTLLNQFICLRQTLIKLFVFITFLAVFLFPGLTHGQAPAAPAISAIFYPTTSTPVVLENSQLQQHLTLGRGDTVNLNFTITKDNELVYLDITKGTHNLQIPISSSNFESPDRFHRAADNTIPYAISGSIVRREGQLEREENSCIAALTSAYVATHANPYALYLTNAACRENSIGKKITIQYLQVTLENRGVFVVDPKILPVQ